MISRLMLSLKKASRSRESGWTSDALSRTHPKASMQIEFERPPSGTESGGGTASEEVALTEIGDGQVNGRNGEGTV